MLGIKPIDLIICSYLSERDLNKLRLVTRSFKALIDEIYYNRYLCHPSMEQYEKRLALLFNHFDKKVNIKKGVCGKVATLIMQLYKYIQQLTSGIGMPSIVWSQGYDRFDSIEDIYTRKECHFLRQFLMQIASSLIHYTSPKNNSKNKVIINALDKIFALREIKSNEFVVYSGEYYQKRTNQDGHLIIYVYKDIKQRTFACPFCKGKMGPITHKITAQNTNDVCFKYIHINHFCYIYGAYSFSFLTGRRPINTI